MSNTYQASVMFIFMMMLLSVGAFISVWAIGNKALDMILRKSKAVNVEHNERFDYWEAKCPDCGIDVWGSTAFTTAQTYAKHWEDRHKGNRLQAVK